ncbi:MAG: GNAT family N-acetyltransferase [Streptosporangiaceae bacterium]
MKVAVTAAETIDDVLPGEWDRLVADEGFYLSHDWLRFVAAEPNEDSRYLLARDDDGVLIGGLVLTQIRDAKTARYRPQHFDELLGTGDDILVAGATRGYRSSLLLAGAADSRPEVLAALLREALTIAQAQRRAGIVLPYLTSGALTEVADLVRVRVGFELPEAELRGIGAGITEYAAAASRRVRTKIRSDRKRFADAGWRLRERDLRECWRDAARLFGNLRSKYGHGDQDLAELEATLAGQARLLADRAVTFTCEDDAGIVGIAVWYRWRDTLYGRLAGFDYDRLRGGAEYFTVAIYGPADYAARHGVTTMHLGTGSWEAKGYRGAILSPLWSAFIPADAQLGLSGLDLVNASVADRWARDIAQRSITMDAGKWHLGSYRAGSVA